MKNNAHNATVADESEIHVWGDHRELSRCGPDGREELFGTVGFVILH